MSRKRSDIWVHFKAFLGYNNKAFCNYCQQVLSISGGLLGNLIRHMKRMHPTMRLKNLRSENSQF